MNIIIAIIVIIVATCAHDRSNRLREDDEEERTTNSIINCYCLWVNRFQLFIFMISFVDDDLLNHTKSKCHSYQCAVSLVMPSG